MGDGSKPGALDRTQPFGARSVSDEEQTRATGMPDAVAQLIGSDHTEPLAQPDPTPAPPLSTRATALRGGPSPATTAVRGGPSPTPPARPSLFAGPPKPATEEALLGQKLRHFQVIKLLGKGGMGAVYLGHDTSLDRPVALKVLSPEIAGDGAMVTRFVREARAQARLRHPNVVQIYFIGEDRGLHFFAMEFVDGPTLEAALEAGQSVPWLKALDYIEQAARGLRAALAEGFIHRDVKPSNLLVDGEGHVKLADFGLVKSVNGDAELTRQGVVVGSPLYMAPEQGRGEVVDHRSDIYSLGCSLYHFITGRPPFDSESPVAVMSMHVTDFAVRIRSLKPEVPETVERLVDRMMSKAPGQRFESYDQLLAAIAAARPREGRRLDSTVWKRALGFAVDATLITLIALFVSKWLLVPVLALGVVGIRYLGRTPGKWLVGVEVTDRAGQRLSWRRTLVRAAVAGWGAFGWAATLGVVYLAHRKDSFTFAVERLTLANLFEPFLVIGVLMLILLTWAGGYVLAAFHPRRLAMHDIVAGSEVREGRPLGGLWRRR